MFSPFHLIARVTFSQSPPRKSSNSNNKKGGLLLPNIPVNKDHRTLLDTLAELACAGSSSSDEFVVSTHGSPRRRARAMSEPWFVDDSYRYADNDGSSSSSGVMSLTNAAMMEGGYDDLMDPESLSSASVLTSLAASRSPLTSAYGSSRADEVDYGSVGIGSNSSAASLMGIASWATRKLPGGVVSLSQAVSSQPVLLPQLLEDGTDYSSFYNQNGRIGIYTREERQCIIARFHEKKRRRVWKKKIRYHCRKNLADRRVRVKGRFVRASSMDGEAETDGGDEAVAGGADGDVRMGEGGDAAEISIAGDGGSGSSSRGVVAKRPRPAAGGPAGSAMDGMKAFWQSVASAGNSEQPPATGQLAPATTSTTVMEEEDEDEEEEVDETHRVQPGLPRGTGKRFRRYTIAY